MVSMCNGWDDFQRLNHAYTVASQLAVSPTKTFNVTFNFIHGPERHQDTHDQRSVYELVATWKPVSKLTLGGDGLYGHEQNGIAVGHDALWKGLAGYAKYSLTSRFSLAFRGEVFNDGGGTRTGTDQTLQGFTLTPEYDMNAKFSRLNSHFRKADGKFAVRGEVRLDLSDQECVPRRQQSHQEAPAHFSGEPDLSILRAGLPESACLLDRFGRTIVRSLQSSVRCVLGRRFGVQMSQDMMAGDCEVARWGLPV